MKKDKLHTIEIDDQKIIFSVQFICNDGDSPLVKFMVDEIPFSVRFHFTSDDSEEGAKICQREMEDHILNVELLNWGKTHLGVASPWKWPLAKVNGKQVTLAAWGDSVSDRLLIFVQFMMENNDK